MYPVSPQAYDRASTVFSPDGRLFQVEYAKEAVKRGSTTIGLVCKDGVVLIANRFVPNKLINRESIRKIHIIDDHIIAASSGLAGDARRLVEMARLEAQKHRITYSEPVSVLQLSKQLADSLQMYTQYGGVRPFGVAMLITGLDEDKGSVYELEPSGAYTGYFAAGIGSGKETVEGILEKSYSPDMPLDKGIALGLKALLESCSEDERKMCNEETLDVAIVSTKEERARYLTPAEIKKYLAKAK